MVAVYGQAQEVLIWLGPESRDTSIAVQAFQAYAAGEPERTAAVRARHSKPWRVVMKLIGNPYWNRIWIIQKIGDARKKTIYCGDQEVRWRIFAIWSATKTLASSDVLTECQLLTVIIWSSSDQRQP